MSNNLFSGEIVALQEKNSHVMLKNDMGLSNATSFNFEPVDASNARLYTQGCVHREGFPLAAQ